jgi:hypothetical protein
MSTFYSPSRTNTSENFFFLVSVLHFSTQGLLGQSGFTALIQVKAPAISPTTALFIISEKGKYHLML